MAQRSVSLKMDPDDLERLRVLAERRDRTPHYLMREAVLQYIQREESRTAFLAEAVEAWRDYQETGAHATVSEVNAWLNTWGTSTEPPTGPECHE
jgi:predicted transcriptional regulator